MYLAGEERADSFLMIGQTTSEANEAVILIRELKRQIKDRLERTKNPKITAAAAGLAE